MTDVEWIQGIRVPSDATLKKYFYGDPDERRRKWKKILVRQGYVCAICGGKPNTGILHIEHEHVRGWKKFPAEVRQRYVRGLVCQFCNRFVLARTMTLKKARAIVAYLEAYNDRKARDG